MSKFGLIACFVCFSFAAFAQASGNQAKPLSPLEQALIANTKAIPEAQKAKDVAFLKRVLTETRRKLWGARATVN